MSQEANNLTEFMSAEEHRAYDKAKAKLLFATNDPLQQHEALDVPINANECASRRWLDALENGDIKAIS